jgi:hypothetical protein
METASVLFIIPPKKCGVINRKDNTYGDVDPHWCGFQNE